VELDPEPVSSVLLGDHGEGAGAEERIEHEPGPPAALAAASGQQLAADGQSSEAGGPPPGEPAACADPLRTGSEQRTLDQPRREGREVRSVVAGGRQAPDIAGVLAERVTGEP